MTGHVFCCICGVRWDAQAPGVLYRSGDRRWWCADGASCFARRSCQRIPEDVFFGEPS